MDHRIPERRRAARIIAAMAAVAAAGCASMSSLEAPDVTLVDIRAVDVTVFETTLETELRVSNPNPEPLSIEGAAFKLYLDGKKVGSGMSPDEVEVPRLGTAVLKATVHINNASAVLRLREIYEDREVVYGLRGKLYVGRNGGTVRMKIEREGQLDLTDPIAPGPLESVDVPGEDATQP
jgi:LEA14-like dessication related protein